MDRHTEPWGVEVIAVEIKEINFPTRCREPWPKRPRPNANGGQR